MEEIKQMDDADKILELPISYEEKGKEIGKEIGKKEVALNLLREGSSVEFIARVTRLDKIEIEKLKGKL